jgi:hypothetical protein
MRFGYQTPGASSETIYARTHYRFCTTCMVTNLERVLTKEMGIHEQGSMAALPDIAAPLEPKARQCDLCRDNLKSLLWQHTYCWARSLKLSASGYTINYTLPIMVVSGQAREVGGSGCAWQCNLSRANGRPQEGQKKRRSRLQGQQRTDHL